MININRENEDFEILSFLEKCSREQEPAFMSSFNQFSKYSIETAYLLNKFLRNAGGKESYFTYFCNSGIEAIHSAIKIIRHSLFLSKSTNKGGNTILYDPDVHYSNIFNQFFEDKKSLIGNFLVLDNLTALEQFVTKEDLILIYSVSELNQSDVQYLKVLKKRSSVFLILDFSRIENSINCLNSLDVSIFDVFVWGEDLTEKKLPFGAISVKASLYSIWNTANTFALHTNTYGGNSIVLRYVLDVLKKRASDFSEEKGRKYAKNIDLETFKAKYYLASKLINSYSPVPLLMTNSRPDFEKAVGAFLYQKGNPHPILDCFGGSGVNYIGHNNQNFLSLIKNSYSVDIDYFEKLRQLMFQKTGLSQILYSVSGAAAVDNAIKVALSCRPLKNKIIFFKGNFSGKSLISINLTSGDQTKFGPLFEGVIELDGSSPTIVEEFNKAVSNDDVALVWFEFIQGRNLRALDIKLIKAIEENRLKYNYLVGVDEILNGIYRTGEFISINGFLQPDIITFSKALSASFLPISLTLLSEEVYQNALKNNGTLILTLGKHFKSQLAAHVSIKLIEYMESYQIPNNVKEFEILIDKEKNALIDNSWYLKDIETYGLHIKLNFCYDKFPLNIFGKQHSDSIINYLFFNQANVLCISNRLLPPLNLKNEEFLMLMKGIDIVSKYSRVKFLLIGIKLLIKQRILLYTSLKLSKAKMVN